MHGAGAWRRKHETPEEGGAGGWGVSAGKLFSGGKGGITGRQKAEANDTERFDRQTGMRSALMKIMTAIRKKYFQETTNETQYNADSIPCNILHDLHLRI